MGLDFDWKMVGEFKFSIHFVIRSPPDLVHNFGKAKKRPNFEFSKIFSKTDFFFYFFCEDTWPYEPILLCSNSLSPKNLENPKILKFTDSSDMGLDFD